MTSTRSSPSNTSSPSRTDSWLAWIVRAVAALAGAIVVFIVGFLVVEAVPALQHIGLARFLTDPSWHPTEDRYNLIPIFSGSLLATSGAVLVATPIAILSAVFCRFYAPNVVATVYRRIVELLAGIPSVVYGFWGLMVLVPFIRRLEPPGTSLLAGICILTVMILPTIMLTADASLAKVPADHVRGAVALGLRRWAIVWGIVVPSARSGLFTGVILGTGRAVGETMAILMVCGNIVRTPDSLFDPIRTLTSNIALEIAYAVGDHRSALFVTGLLLMVTVIALIGAAEWVGRGRLYG